MRCNSERSEESVSTPLCPPTTVILTLNEMKGKNLGVDYLALSQRACPGSTESP